MRTLTCQFSGSVSIRAHGQAGGCPSACSWNHLPSSLFFRSHPVTPSAWLEQLPQLHVVGVVGAQSATPVLAIVSHQGGDKGLRTDGWTDGRGRRPCGCLAVLEASQRRRREGLRPSQSHCLSAALAPSPAWQFCLLQGPVLWETGRRSLAWAPGLLFYLQVPPQGPVVPNIALLSRWSLRPEHCSPRAIIIITTLGPGAERGSARQRSDCFTLQPRPVGSRLPLTVPVEAQLRAAKPQGPVWKIPLPNHLGPTSIAILPHKGWRAIDCTTTSATAQKPRSDAKRSPLACKTEFREKENKAAAQVSSMETPSVPLLTAASASFPG